MEAREDVLGREEGFLWDVHDVRADVLQERRAQRRTPSGSRERGKTYAKALRLDKLLPVKRARRRRLHVVVRDRHLRVVRQERPCASRCPRVRAFENETREWARTVNGGVELERNVACVA